MNIKNNLTTRRDFIKTTCGITAASFGLSAFHFKKKEPLLSFSTLGCPDWSLNKIVDFAAQHGFKGIEVRGLLRQMDLTQSKEFNPQNMASSKRLLHDKGLKFINLGASTNLHISEANERKKHIDEGKRFIDLADKLDCPYIRVFPDKLPTNRDKSQTLDLIAHGLLELAEYAQGSKVSVLMETHGDVLYADDILQVMKAAAHKHTGLVWDLANMWMKTKEPPALMFEKLKNYIRHTHLKNEKLVNDQSEYTRIAKGDVPVFEMIDLLYNNGYKGYYSFEWEKMWHPELEDPELAIADYAMEMKRYFKEKAG